MSATCDWDEADKGCVKNGEYSWKTATWQTEMEMGG